MSKETEKRDEFIYTIIKERFNVDWTRIDALDSKASGIIGFAGIILSLEGAFGKYILEKTPRDNIYYLATFIFLLGVMFLALSVFCALEAYRIRKWTIVPEPAHLIENYAKKERDLIDMRRIISTEISKAIKSNKKPINDKVEFVQTSLVFLFLGILSNISFYNYSYVSMKTL